MKIFFAIEREDGMEKYDIGLIQDLSKNNKISIEHIAPQNILPGVKPFDNVNLIGNLVLTFDNSTLTNKTFDSKKKIYASSNLSSERELISYKEWNDKSIIERGKKLQKFIMERWKP